jgi:hypothetical protein
MTDVDLMERWNRWKSSPPAPGDPTFVDLLKAADAEMLRAMRCDDVVIITKMPDVAQGEAPWKIDGMAYIRDVAAGRK